MIHELPDSQSPDALRSPTVDRSGKRKWIYPDRRWGRYSRQRGIIAFFLIFIYLTAPFIKIQGMPLIRFDISSGIVYALGQTFRFADGFYFVFVLLSAAMLLAWATSLWGRIWCGYGCPQTVFVEWLIRPIEEWIEGSALRRKKNDSLPLTLELAGKKLVKYGLFSLVIFAISNVLLAYFVDPKVLWQWVHSSPAEEPVAFSIMSFVFAALFFDLVWFREQFCAYLCPYGRFQSVLISVATPTVAYDYNRGEPRGKRNVKGDCIDCGLCVRVCPTGIDIRQGLQLECIQCMRCSDACNIIMSTLKRPPGLIRNASKMEIDRIAVTKKFRIRPLVFFLLFLASISTLGFFVINRSSLKTTILRQSKSTFVTLDNGHIANYFTIRVVNQSHAARIFTLSTPSGMQLVCSLCGQAVPSNQEVVGSLIVMFDQKDARSNLDLLVNDSAKISLSLLHP